VQEFLKRTEPFLGPEGLDALTSQTIAIAGLGQAGFCAESGLEDMLHRYVRLMQEIVT
jgi:tRNA A37 threonylcarbamoyladenosine dehydratase